MRNMYIALRKVRNENYFNYVVEKIDNTQWKHNYRNCLLLSQSLIDFVHRSF